MYAAFTRQSALSAARVVVPAVVVVVDGSLGRAEVGQSSRLWHEHVATQGYRHVVV